MAKLVYGVGINDADYVIRPLVNNKQVYCRIYNTWTRMLERCYSDLYHATSPTYIECSVSPEWHKFSNFKEWYLQQGDVTGKDLDKDILYPGNKVYGPDTCIFVDRKLNTLLKKFNTRSLPTGVRNSVNSKKYRAYIKINGKSINLGYYHTIEEAYQAYINAKIQHIQDYYLSKEPDQRIIDALNRWIELMRNGQYELV